MPNYIIAYYDYGKGPKGAEGGDMPAYQAWLKGLGDAVVNPGTPLGKTKTVTADGVSEGAEPKGLTGFTTVEADSMEAALEMAKTCPYLQVGNIEVSEVMKM